jgi:nucleoside-diphosphate-sugar epimerase
MAGTTVVLGFGAVGRPTALALLARGDAVRVAQRNRPAGLPAQAGFRTCDVLDAASVRQAIDGASQVVMAVAFPYDVRVWRTSWPRAMTNLVEACAATGARLVFLDNLISSDRRASRGARTCRSRQAAGSQACLRR